MSTRRALRVFGVALALSALAGSAWARPRMPNIVLVVVDTLRADRLSAYGYSRDTSPRIDDLLERGLRFDNARTPIPLTNPAMGSVLTSRYPHEHGATRNGIRLRPGIESLPKALDRRGFATAAFVGNWTLRDEISGLAEHFSDYHEILTRKRWFMWFREATADDITNGALEWLGDHRTRRPSQPFFLWLHYVEPHAPYRSHDEYREQLGFSSRGSLSPSSRYDTEIAAVDASIGRFLDGLGELTPADETLVVFLSDHGEGLGEHGEWGHGRHLFETTVRVPLGIVWDGVLDPGVVDGAATLQDVAPTVLGLIDHPPLDAFGGFDWTPVVRSEASSPDREVFLQAHKGAVQGVEETDRARRRGLLALGRVNDTTKEILRVRDGQHSVFDLVADADEERPVERGKTKPSDALETWASDVVAGLEAADELPVQALDAEETEQMKALGYVD